MPSKPQPFDCIAGHFAPTGPCGGFAPGVICPAIGWDMLMGLCSECFRLAICEPKEREVGALWGLAEAVRIFGRETPPQGGSVPTSPLDEQVSAPSTSGRGRQTLGKSVGSGGLAATRRKEL